MVNEAKTLKFNLLTIALTIFLIISSFFSYTFSKDIENKYSDKAELTFNGHNFMEASSYLTNEVRSYASTGNEIHFENYWNEVNELKNRDIALARMKEIGITDEEIAIIEEMSGISNYLVPLEAKAMENVQEINLSTAMSYVYGAEYSADILEINMLKEEFLTTLDNRTSIEVKNLNIQNDILQVAICMFTFIIIVMQIINYLKNKAIICDIDVFSGLYNRKKYINVIEKISNNKKGNLGIVQIDINGLSEVNKQYGYAYGDKLILKVVSLLQACFANNIFRTGDDEFVALVLEGNYVKFKEKVFEFRNIMEIETDVSVSSGSTWCSDMRNIDQQIVHANELMYVEKQNYYATLDSNKKDYKATSATELQAALAKKDFLIVLQPKIRLKDEKVIGAEALVRRKNGQGGFLFPDKFISLYESDGIISLLDFYVLEAVCELQKKWRDEGHPAMQISVNFSRLTILEYDVAKKINNVCKKYEVDPKYINIELTEHISCISLENLNEILESIKSFGFQISLDDFGREYANLSILSNIAFDEVKLDKSLIDNLAHDPAISISTRCIIEMCNAFRPTKIVLEGIETAEQVVKLRELGNFPLIVQGYFFSRPISTDDFLQYYVKTIG